MNSDILQGRWKQVRGRAQGWWGKLARRNRVRVRGKRDELAGTLQVKYGNVRAKAKQTLHRILK